MKGQASCSDRLDGSPLDILIVGAGISGIGLAAHLVRKCPGKRFIIVDRRKRAGGTWDLFRYPGVRSDSDMFTLGYSFAPWRKARSIVSGGEILGYLDEVVAKHDLGRRTRFGLSVTSADWNSGTGLWTVRMQDEAGGEQALSARFLFLASGYYDYDEPHDARIPGVDSFSGEVIHPQFWPQDADYRDKQVVVIGSGATAATLVPALAAKAAKVTMLQRTPTWYLTLPAEDRAAAWLRRLLPARAAYALTRLKNIRMQDVLFSKSRNEPEGMKAFLRKQLKEQLGEDYDRVHFTPPYGPWEQRMCLIPDGDLFAALRSGKAEMVTGQIDHADAHGIVLADGRRLDADVIVTATGLKVILAGNIALSVDGAPVSIADHFYYRACMFSNLPNLAGVFGYLNASWTLRVDLVGEWLCRLLRHMDAIGADVVTPYLPADHGLVEDSPFDGYSSGYLRRAKHLIPKSSATEPWRIGMDYLTDRKEIRNAPIDDGVLQFGRVPAALAAE